jgi:RNA polymerase sigma-70 factor (ECF subfamily)
MSDFHNLLVAEIPPLRRYARARVRNANSADDLVQDTLTRALEKAALWAPCTSLRVWLFTVMHNQHVDSVRRPSREAARLDSEDISQTLIAATDPSASCRLHELDIALAQLRQEERQVILLVGLEGLRYDEAAQILRVPLGTVASRLSSGRDQLRRLMDMTSKDGTFSGAAPSYKRRRSTPRRRPASQLRRAACLTRFRPLPLGARHDESGFRSEAGYADAGRRRNHRDMAASGCGRERS